MRLELVHRVDDRLHEARQIRRERAADAPGGGGRVHEDEFPEPAGAFTDLREDVRRRAGVRPGLGQLRAQQIARGRPGAGRVLRKALVQGSEMVLGPGERPPAQRGVGQYQPRLRREQRHMRAAVRADPGPRRLLGVVQASQGEVQRRPEQGRDGGGRCSGPGGHRGPGVSAAPRRAPDTAASSSYSSVLFSVNVIKGARRSGLK
nr:hypothetical protein [Streptomyces clavuligerus]